MTIPPVGTTLASLFHDEIADALSDLDAASPDESCLVRRT